MTIECSNPYPGPESFARGDDRPYFGREQETTDLSSLAVTERLLVFYAPSGAGKTSLLKALTGLELDGIIGFPLLRQLKFSINYPKETLYIWDRTDL